MEKVFIQMSGAPGAGKSTIARAIAPQIDAVVIDQNLAAGNRFESGNTPQSRGLPATARTQQATDLALMQCQRQVVEHLLLAVALPNMSELQ